MPKIMLPGHSLIVIKLKKTNKLLRLYSFEIEDLIETQLGKNDVETLEPHKCKANEKIV